jgi:hypothetical protein
MTKGPGRGEHKNGLEQVRFATAIIPEYEIRTVRKRQALFSIISEISQIQ